MGSQHRIICRDGTVTFLRRSEEEAANNDGHYKEDSRIPPKRKHPSRKTRIPDAAIHTMPCHPHLVGPLAAPVASPAKVPRIRTCGVGDRRAECFDERKASETPGVLETRSLGILKLAVKLPWPSFPPPYQCTKKKLAFLKNRLLQAMEHTQDPSTLTILRGKGL